MGRKNGQPRRKTRKRGGRAGGGLNLKGGMPRRLVLLNTAKLQMSSQASDALGVRKKMKAGDVYACK